MNRVVQRIAYLVGVTLALLLIMAGMAWLTMGLQGLIGSTAVLLMWIVSLGAGALWIYFSAQLCVWLAERGWFV